jgi:hypothetical protein
LGGPSLSERRRVDRQKFIPSKLFQTSMRFRFTVHISVEIV